MPYTIGVNGRVVEIDAPATEPLAFVLRNRLNLRGTKIGCMEGRCGSCTVLVDGRPTVSCLYPVGLTDGTDVRTVEGLAAPHEELSPLQAAFLAQGAVQCGICTPGILMSLTAFLAETPNPSEADVRGALAGNLCRCTGYRKIIDAALSVAAGRSE